RRQYHPDRAPPPAEAGRKAWGREVCPRVSWDEALDLVASEMKRVRETYGPGALFVPYGTGSYNQTNGSHVARRLMNVAGGCLGIWNSYSWAAINVATPTVYGTLTTGNQRQDWVNAKLILMWGWNPAEMRDGTNSDFFLKLARQRGARVVCIDPRHSLSAASLADEWIPIRPGTDAAPPGAMAYVTVTEVYDAEFVRTHCRLRRLVDAAGVRGGTWLRDHLSARGTASRRRSGPSRSPPCRARRSPAAREVRVRRSRASSTRATGCSDGAYGEQVVRGGCVLAALAGTSGSRAAGPRVSGTRRPTAAPSGPSSRPARTRSARRSRASSGPRRS
ncbi:MAG: molybdopterin-dependent oxidoreductase, partial [Holophagales bacterium]|nr:molybdopterin-dependent oxidoreductase [Holophagales bacterium]